MSGFFLQEHERGRGVQLSKERLAEVKAYCLMRLQDGLTQKQIVKEIGACRSRVSRWINQAIHEANLLSERRKLNTRTRTTTQRLFDRIKFGRHDECWEWMGATRPNGYGSFVADDVRDGAHRVSYRTFVSDIPDGMQIDHICRNPRCVNPYHLQPVSASENLTLAWARRSSDAA